VTSTFTTDLPVNQVDRFCVLGVLASIWQVNFENRGNFVVRGALFSVSGEVLTLIEEMDLLEGGG
jgi:hypothetical protein